MNGVHYSPEDQQKIADAVAAEVASIDTKSRRELLARIHDAVFNLNASDPVKISSVQARLATLLVSVSEQQEKSAAKLEEQTARLVHETVVLRELTKSLRTFTIALFVIAILQVIIMVFDYCSKMH